MKTLVSFLLIVATFPASAQITFTRSDYGSPGDKVIYGVDSPIYSAMSVGSPGTNQVWNFITSQRPYRYDSVLFLSASIDPNAPTIPVNLLARTVANGDMYQEVTDSFVKVVQHMPDFRIFGVKLKVLEFPLTYQTSTADSTNVSTRGSFADFGISPFPPFDSLRIDAKVTLLSTCDGWGTITLPDTIGHEALRVRNIIRIDAKAYGRTIIGWSPFPIFEQSQSNTSYQWYSQNSKSYLAAATIDTFGRITSFTYRVPAAPRGIHSRLVSISPDSAFQGEKRMITIKGFETFFTQGTGPVINMYGIKIDSQAVVDDTTINVWISSTLAHYAGSYTVVVEDPIAGYLYLWNAFRLIRSPLAPHLLSVTPGFAIPGQPADVVIRATHSHFTQGGNTIYFTPGSGGSGYALVNSFSVIDDSTLSCRVLVDSTVNSTRFSVSVHNSVDGMMQLDDCFTGTLNGVEELVTATPAVNIYPNPASDILHVSCNSKTNFDIQVSDITGRILHTSQGHKGTGTLDINELCNGLYVCTIIADGTRTSRRIIVNR